MPEVDHEVKSQQLSTAASDIAVAAEVAVDLPGESIYANERAQKLEPNRPANAAFASAAQWSAMMHFLNSPETKHQDRRRSLRIEAADTLNLWSR